MEKEILDQTLFFFFFFFFSFFSFHPVCIVAMLSNTRRKSFVSVVGLSHPSNRRCLRMTCLRLLQRKVTGSSPVRSILFGEAEGAIGMKGE